jgi:hypothetical protein
MTRTSCHTSHYSYLCVVAVIVKTTTKSIGTFAYVATKSYNQLTTTQVFATPPEPERQPRRNLQKRPRKNRKTPISEQQIHLIDYNDKNIGSLRKQRSLRHPQYNQDEFPWETAERRTFISAVAREAGEDYWIDMEELKRIQDTEQRMKVRRRDTDQISDQKLWIEVLSPYKQNWIGLISVSMIVFAFIFKYFPEVIDPPVITNIPAML